MNRALSLGGVMSCAFALSVCHATEPIVPGQSMQELAPAVRSKPSEPIEYQFNCHYLLDNEETESDTDPNRIEAWIVQMRTSFTPGAAPGAYDVFSHDAGGPMGAEWNSVADLLCIVWVSRPPGEIELQVFEVVGEPGGHVSRAFHHAAGSLWTVRVPADLWLERKRPLEVDDYEFVYTPDALAMAQQAEGASPLGVGEVVDFRVILKMHEGPPHQLEVRRAFHWATGE